MSDFAVFLTILCMVLIDYAIGIDQIKVELEEKSPIGFLQP